MKRYQAYSKSVIGSGHVSSNIPCQDYSLSAFENDVNFIIISDGCGSAAHSELGSRVICECLKNKLVNEFDALFVKEKKEAVHDINLSVQKAIVKEALANGHSPNDYFATYLFFAIKDNKHIACRSGDGGVILFYMDDNVAVFEEDKTGSANETIYFNNPKCEEYMDYDAGEEDILGAFVYCDGIYDGGLNPDVINAIKQFIVLNSFNDRDTVDKRLDEILEGYRLRTNDDCSIALISLAKTQEDKTKIEQVENAVEQAKKKAYIRKIPVITKKFLNAILKKKKKH